MKTLILTRSDRKSGPYVPCLTIGPPYYKIYGAILTLFFFWTNLNFIPILGQAPKKKRAQPYRYAGLNASGFFYPSDQ